MSRLSLRIVGASGQGINTIGEVTAKALKRSGYCVLGYREYPSLIIGGHAGYQLDVDTVPVRSPSTELHAVVTLNYQGLTRYFGSSAIPPSPPAGSSGQAGEVALREGGVLIHSEPDWTFEEAAQKWIEEKHIQVVYLPIERMLRELDAPLVLQNVIFTSFLWAALGRDRAMLKEIIKERFARKEHLIEINMKCVDLGYDFKPEGVAPLRLPLPEPDPRWNDHLLLTGNQAIGLGAIHAGVRFYAGYPMTPTSSLLGFVADLQNKSGMLVKQAEDEITAAQMATGAYFMGTRAMTGTAGGGFDLMTETLSMIGIIENPMVFILGQRPGPATGLPTWTCQGDLFLAVYAGHGEFPRCVLGLSDADDAFRLIGEAHNIAERYQIPVIVLTDKYIAECLFCLPPLDLHAYELERGRLVTNEAELQTLRAADRFRITEDGISPRWVPGQRAPGYDANSDEHTEDGTVTEESSPSRNMFAKRMRKMETLAKALPEPELYHSYQVSGDKGESDLDVLLVGWGSTKNTVLDVLAMLSAGHSPLATRISYLHYTYLWPLKTERFKELTGKAKRVILVEGNYQGQLGSLLEQRTGFRFQEKLLKYDGRPFFFEELHDVLLAGEPVLPHRGIALSS
jgi:2-oxoglutarate ferredoxin oxidoreductase subunit alpha